MTLDGKIATRDGRIAMDHVGGIPERGTSASASSDALVTGSGTVLADNPQLTDRSGLPRRRPLLARHSRSDRAHIGIPGWLAVPRQPRRACRPNSTTAKSRVSSWNAGRTWLSTPSRAGIIDKIVVFVAPKILGGRDIPAIGGEGIESLADAIALTDWSAAAVGPDSSSTGYVHRNH